MKNAEGFHTMPAIDEETALACAAHAAHEAHRTYSVALGEPAPHATWDSLPGEAKKSIIHGVLAVRRGASAEICHQLWMGSQLERGWRWGQDEDDEKKTDPALLHWSCLPEARRRKGELFVSVTRAMLLACGATLESSTAS